MLPRLVFLFLSLVPGGLSVSAQQAVTAPEIVTTNGLSAVRLALEGSRGKILVPVAEAIFDRAQGTVAIELEIVHFSNSVTVFDFGWPTHDRYAISVWQDGSDQRGRFNLVFFDANGTRRAVQSPVIDAGQRCVLAFAYGRDGLSFWLNGKSCGAIEASGELAKLPDQFYLSALDGIQWKRFASCS